MIVTNSGGARVEYNNKIPVHYTSNALQSKYVACGQRWSRRTVTANGP